MINDNLYDDMLAMIESGDQGRLTDDMVDYLALLDKIHSWTFRHFSRDQIIKLLQTKPWNLSFYTATKRYAEAVNFFYIDPKITKEAFRNMYAEKLERAAELILKTATCSKDIDIYKNTILSIKDMRQLDVPEKEDIPDEFFKKPNKIYILNPEIIGRKKADRYKLARHIDQLDIPEKDKQRVKADAMITDIEFLSEDEKTED